MKSLMKLQPNEVILLEIDSQKVGETSSEDNCTVKHFTIDLKNTGMQFLLKEVEEQVQNPVTSFEMSPTNSIVGDYPQINRRYTFNRLKLSITTGGIEKNLASTTGRVESIVLHIECPKNL